MNFAESDNKHAPAGAAGTQTVVRLENITAQRNGVRIFENTDWTIRKGEHWAITGDERADISALAGMLARRMPLVSGRMAYFPGARAGEDTNAGLRAHDVAVVSPESGADLIGRYSGYAQARWQSFEGDMCPTAAELLSPESIENRSPYQTDPLRVDPAVYDARRKYATDLLGIGYLLPRKVLYLSSGEVKKLIIARALMKSPRLLIFDDPHGGLDAASRKTLARCLDALMTDKDGPTVVLATPRPEEIPPGITHLAVVSGGRLVSKGPKPMHLTVLTGHGAPRPEKRQPPPPAFPEPMASPSDTPDRSGTIPLFSLTDVTVRYGGTVILQNVHWTVRRGENWALTGPNGAGKTTLLSLILGDNPQGYANDVRIMGRRRGTGESIWDIRARIGRLSPDLHARYPKSETCLQAVLSGFDETIGCYRSHGKRQQAHAMDWLESLGLERFAQIPLGSLSPARQRMILLARALVKDPLLLLLDEPCQCLAAEGRTMITDTLDRLCRRQYTTLVIVTHHPDEIPEAVSHVLYLSGGRVVRTENRKMPDA